MESSILLSCSTRDDFTLLFGALFDQDFHFLFFDRYACSLHLLHSLNKLVDARNNRRESEQKSIFTIIIVIWVLFEGKTLSFHSGRVFLNFFLSRKFPFQPCSREFILDSFSFERSLRVEWKKTPEAGENNLNSTRNGKKIIVVAHTHAGWFNRHS